MGGCASRPKESDMKNEEGSVPNKPVSETVVVKDNNTKGCEKQDQTETETTCVETKETSEVEPTKETIHVAEPEVAAVEESLPIGEAAPAPEKVENVEAPTEKVEPAMEVANVTAPEKVEVVTEATEVEPVKEEETKKEEKEVVVTV